MLGQKNKEIFITHIIFYNELSKDKNPDKVIIHQNQDVQRIISPNGVLYSDYLAYYPLGVSFRKTKGVKNVSFTYVLRSLVFSFGILARYSCNYHWVMEVEFKNSTKISQMVF